MIKRIAVFLILFFVISSPITGQVLLRSKGLGIRGGIWNSKAMGTNLSASGDVVSISGFGGSLFFFSRAGDHLFIETNIGGMASVHVGDDVEVSSLTAFLFGLRWDAFPSRSKGSFYPYYGFGLGPYGIIRTKVTETPFDEDVSIGSDFKFGFYGSVGTFLNLSNWFAFTFDLKYHVVDFPKDNRYGGVEFSTGFCFLWGRKRELFRIKEIKVIVRDIYPAYYPFYETYPLALVTVQNTVPHPIEVKVKTFVKDYTERIYESGFVKIPAGETKDIPIHALFGGNLLHVDQRKPAMLDVELEARAQQILTKSVSTSIMIHHRNAWNGDVDKLGFFITPDEDSLMKISRSMINALNGQSFDERHTFLKGKVLYQVMKDLKIQYVSDPNIPFYQDDRVQYAMETINMKTGDCDDLVVLYASLLESAGIQTAFVDVRDPEKSLAHVYLLFDTGVSSEKSDCISTNEKRFVIRESQYGYRSVWIPVETTLIDQNFEDAWKAGALQYLQEGILRNGIAEGWVKIIDVQ